MNCDVVVWIPIRQLNIFQLINKTMKLKQKYHELDKVWDMLIDSTSKFVISGKNQRTIQSLVKK